LPPWTTPHAVVFDFDGVLMSTGQVWDRAYAALFASYRLQLTVDDRRRLATLPLTALGLALADLLDHRAPPDVLTGQLFELIASNVGQPATVVPGARELVAALHGRCPLAVASNSPTAAIRAHLTKAGLAEYFAAIVGADQVHQPKPAPDVYRRVCSLLGVAPKKAVAVEDSDVGVIAARTAGLYTVGIGPPGVHLSADAMFPALNDPDLRRLLDARGPPTRPCSTEQT
jgi:HAD superfamily hydrolase (TIGR01509 family)